MNSALSKFTFLVLLLTGISSHSKALKLKLDYLVNAKGDTVVGTVRGNTLTLVMFKGNAEAKYTRYPVSEVKAFRMSGVEYTSQIVPGENTPCFLKILERGSITLYEYVASLGGGAPIGLGGSSVVGGYSRSFIKKWFAKKDTNSFIEIKSNDLGSATRKQRRQDFIKLISDDQEAVSYYLVHTVDEEKIILDTIKKYNQRKAAKNMNTVLVK